MKLWDFLIADAFMTRLLNILSMQVAPSNDLPNVQKQWFLKKAKILKK